MRNQFLLLNLFALLLLGACQSESASKTAETTPAAAPAPAPTIAVPDTFVVDINERSVVTIQGQTVGQGEFEKIIAGYFDQYKKAGATKMPVLKFRLDGTVMMGIRGELETEYKELKEQYEAGK